MNSIRTCVAFLIGLLTLGTAMAEGAKRATTSSKPARNDQRVVTGSMIPERTASRTRFNNMTRPTGPVVILTSADIQRIGARDLADALSRGIAIGR